MQSQTTSQIQLRFGFRSAVVTNHRSKISNWPETGIFTGFSAAASARPSSTLEEHGEVSGDELVAVGPRPGGRVVALARHVALQEHVVVHLLGWLSFNQDVFLSAQG